MRLLFLTCPLLRSGLPRAALRPMSAIPDSSRSALHATRVQLDEFASYDGDDAMTTHRPPSEKQIAYAQRLSLRTEIPLSPEALESSSSCAAYIQRALGSVPPSEKQVAFAMELAQRAGEVLPESAYESSASVSSYIDAKRGGSAPYAGGAPRGPGAPLGAYGGGLADGASMDAPPTSKQINYLVSLAVRHRSGIPYEALSNRRACSDLIEDLLSKGPAQGSGAATAATPAGPGSAPGDVPPPAGTTLFNDADIPF